METARKTTICSQSTAPSSSESSAATAPATNQMETSPAVAASAMPKMTMAAIHTNVMLPPEPPFMLWASAISESRTIKISVPPMSLS